MLLTRSSNLKFSQVLPGISDVTTPIETPPEITFEPALKPSKFVTANLVNPEYASAYKEAVELALTCTKTELQNFYTTEYNSHRSRKQQAKERHIKFADSLKDFRDWLIHTGPRPCEGYTVDRINYAKGYIPNNLRWASKLKQTQNRKVTKWHVMPDGIALTTMQLAKRLDLPYKTLYKRLSTGWTIERLIASNDAPPTLAGWKFPEPLFKHCEPLYRQNRKHFTTTRIDWFLMYLEQSLNPLSPQAQTLELKPQLDLNTFYVQATKDKACIVERQAAETEKNFRNLVLCLQSLPAPTRPIAPRQRLTSTYPLPPPQAKALDPA